MIIMKRTGVNVCIFSLTARFSPGASASTSQRRAGLIGHCNKKKKSPLHVCSECESEITGSYCDQMVDMDWAEGLFPCCVNQMYVQPILASC